MSNLIIIKSDETLYVENDIQFYTDNAVEIAGKAGLGRRINTAMQVGSLNYHKSCHLMMSLAFSNKMRMIVMLVNQ
jgi:hypothetical protein